ncbi:hypothetical protein Y032_0143g2406 [Ancylostoma ceylanicum]|uniref:Uncharacterized protein n=1 Tax=Ancylostoma ceylanicum TaxID=53326 RepID=A0A016T3H8_9BILA|nr:hypothetical protein Y032_0143g2406 [Ancylostoma ceylanicum]
MEDEHLCVRCSSRYHRCDAVLHHFRSNLEASRTITLEITRKRMFSNKSYILSPLFRALMLLFYYLSCERVDNPNAPKAFE